MVKVWIVQRATGNAVAHRNAVRRDHIDGRAAPRGCHPMLESSEDDLNLMPAQSRGLLEEYVGRKMKCAIRGIKRLLDAL